MGDTLERYVVERLETLEQENERLFSLVGSMDEVTDAGTLRPGNGASFRLLSSEGYRCIKKDGAHYWKKSQRGQQLTTGDLQELLEMDDQELIDLCLEWDTTCGDHVLAIEKKCECVLEVTRADGSVKRFAVCQCSYCSDFSSLLVVPVTDLDGGFLFGEYFHRDRWDEFKEDIACELRGEFRKWLEELADEEKAQ